MKQIINTPKLLEGYLTQANTPLIKKNGNVRSSLPIEYVVTSQGNELDTNAYNNRRTRKINSITQIFLHHTAGWPKQDKGASTVRTFNQRVSGGKGSTHCIIDADGILDRCVPEDRIAYAQGNNNSYGMSLEIQAVGALKKSGDIFLAYGKDISTLGLTSGKPVKFDGATEYTFRGYEYYQAYTPQQCVTTINIIKEWCYRYNIKFVFDQKAYNLMFPPLGQAPINKKNTPGVFSHCSVRPSGKTDIYPDKTLVNMFKQHFGKNDNTNPTVSSFNPSASIPRNVPIWNPTKMST